MANAEPLISPRVAGFTGAGGAESFETAALKHALDAVDMVAIGDHDAGIEVHPLEDLRGSGDAMRGAVAFRLDDDSFGGDAAADEIVAPDFAFGEDGIAAGATGGHDGGGEAAAEEFQAMIQART